MNQSGPLLEDMRCLPNAEPGGHAGFSPRGHGEISVEGRVANVRVRVKLSEARAVVTQSYGALPQGESRDLSESRKEQKVANGQDLEKC